MLWRDGNNAVVSLQLADGSWSRVLQTDCRGVFHVEMTGEAIEALAMHHRRTIEQRKRRGSKRAPQWAPGMI